MISQVHYKKAQLLVFIILDAFELIAIKIKNHFACINKAMFLLRNIINIKIHTGASECIIG